MGKCIWNGRRHAVVPQPFAFFPLHLILSRQRPVLLVIEDAHWADRAIRSFIAFLSRALTAERVLAGAPIVSR